MGWETRSGKRVYYRKVRDGHRVRSIYCGSGESGERAAREDIERRSATLKALAHSQPTESLPIRTLPLREPENLDSVVVEEEVGEPDALVLGLLQLLSESLTAGSDLEVGWWLRISGVRAALKHASQRDLARRVRRWLTR